MPKLVGSQMVSSCDKASTRLASHLPSASCLKLQLGHPRQQRVTPGAVRTCLESEVEREVLWAEPLKHRQMPPWVGVAHSPYGGQDSAPG